MKLYLMLDLSLVLLSPQSAAQLEDEADLTRT